MQGPTQEQMQQMMFMQKQLQQVCEPHPIVAEFLLAGVSDATNACCARRSTRTDGGADAKLRTDAKFSWPTSTPPSSLALFPPN